MAKLYLIRGYNFLTSALSLGNTTRKQAVLKVACGSFPSLQAHYGGGLKVSSRQIPLWEPVRDPLWADNVTELQNSLPFFRIIRLHTHTFVIYTACSLTTSPLSEAGTGQRCDPVFS